MTKTRVKGETNLAAPWTPTETTPAEIGAIKALVEGKADERQQLLLVEWLARASGVTELEFRPGPEGERASAFAGGKRFVGQQFFQLAKTSLARSTAAPTKGQPAS
jgi:hypothetical protein